jgi:hypothetical protein
MALVNSNQYGQSYLFGFLSTDAPTITGFVARSAELRYEAETFVQAQDGEGVTESVVTTKPTARKITATFGGYIISGFDGSGIGDHFTFGSPTSRFFIVRNVSVPKRKGEFNEVSLEAESYFLITTGPNP